MLGCWLGFPHHTFVEAKSLKCEALSGVSIVIALEYFNEVLIADDVHCHAGVGGGSIQVVDL